MNSKKKLPVDKNRYSSRTYWRTGQPYVGLGAWLLYRNRKLKSTKKGVQND